MFRRVAIMLVSTAVVLTGCSAPDEEVSDTSTVVDRRATPPEIAAAGLSWLQQVPVEQGLVQSDAAEDAAAVYDLTIDTALALSMLGDEEGASELTTGLIRSESLEEYAGDGKNHLNVRNTSRIIADVVASGYNPKELSGRSLVQELKSLQNSSGRFVDLGGDDTSNTSSQAWAVMALSAADKKPESAVSFLTVQQCESGGYPLELSDRPDGKCASDLEATALTVSALLAARIDASAPEVDRAVTWLEGQSTRDEQGVFWTTGKSKEPDTRVSAAVTIALVDAYAKSGDPLRWLRSNVVKSGDDAGALERSGAADHETTALGVLAFSGRGYSNLFR